MLAVSLYSNFPSPILSLIFLSFFCHLSLSLSDIDKIHNGIGDKFAILIQLITTFFAGFVIGFIRGWELTLLLIVVTPFMVFGAAVFSKVLLHDIFIYIYIISSPAYRLLQHLQVKSRSYMLGLELLLKRFYHQLEL